MADLEKTVAIIFEGVDQMGAGITSATKQIDGLAGSVQDATQPLADATLGILKFEGALVATGAAVTAFAVKLAGDFDSQFREISTLIDAPSEALADFRGELLEYGRDSTQSLDQVNAAVYGAISAGVDYTDSLDAVRQAELLAVAGRASLAESNTLLVSSLNAYGESAEEAERYSDLLFATVRAGQTTLPELAQALSQVTGVAAAGGVEFEELLGAVATLTATGSPTTQAVTQIRGAISAIIKPTSEAATLASELGIEFNAAALETQGLAGVLDAVAEATGGNTAEMARLFGSVEALNGVLTLTGTGAGKFDETLAALEGSAGATAEAYEKMAGDIENGTQRIQNALQGALIGVGDPLLDEFGGIQEAIAGIFNAIGASVDGGQLEGFVSELEAMFGGIETTLREVAKNLPEALEAADFSSFFDGIQAIQDAVSQLFDGADLTSADGLVTVIETLGLGFEALAQYTAGAITQIGPFLEQVAELAQWFLELDPAVFATAGAIGGLAVVVNTLATAVIAVNGPLRAFAGSGGVLAQGTSIIKGMVGVLTGPLGLAAATAAVGTALYKAGEQFVSVNRDIDASREAHAELARAVSDGRKVWDYAVGDYVDAADAQVTLQDEVNASRQAHIDFLMSVRETSTEQERNERAIRSAAAQYTNWDLVVEEAMKSSAGFRQEQEATAESLRGVLDAIGPIEEGWQQVADGVFASTNNVAALEDAYADVKAAFDDGLISQAQFDNITDYYEQLKSGADTGKDAEKSLADAALQTEEAILAARDAVLEQELAFEQLASNERIAAIEFSAGVDIAQIEADVREIEAVFASLDNTITSTGEVLTGLYGSLGSGDLSRLQELDLEKILREENAARQEALALEQELVEAQIQNLQAKTDALRSGDGLIKIDSTGLEPSLEMILWEIIQKVQLRANAEGQEFLLGLN